MNILKNLNLQYRDVCCLELGSLKESMIRNHRCLIDVSYVSWGITNMPSTCHYGNMQRRNRFRTHLKFLSQKVFFSLKLFIHFLFQGTKVIRRSIKGYRFPKRDSFRVLLNNLDINVLYYFIKFSVSKQATLTAFQNRK